MILRNSQILVTDNSGPRVVKCVGTFGGSNHVLSVTGENIRVTIKKWNPENTLDCKNLYKALIVSSVRRVTRRDGSTMCFYENRSFILNDGLKLLGSRIFGPVDKQFYRYKVKTNKKQKKQVTLETKYRAIFSQVTSFS